MSDFDVNNGYTINKDLLMKVLEALHFLDDWTTTEFEKPKDFAYIKTFRNRTCSMVILLRPGVLERKSKSPLNFKYTGDDFIIIEYDDIVNEVVQVKLVKFVSQLRKLVDSNNGIVIIKE